MNSAAAKCEKPIELVRWYLELGVIEVLGIRRKEKTMAKKLGKLMFSLWVVAFLLVLPQNVFSASLPHSTQEMLKKLRLDPSILANIDRELEVPKGWIEKAKKEGKLRIIGSGFQPSLVRAAQLPFRERYPFDSISSPHEFHNLSCVSWARGNDD